MRVVAAAATDIGLVRERNEDSFLVHGPLFAVADGMGGHRGGDVASNLALETVETLFEHGNADLPGLLREANRAVLQRSLLDRRVAGMGTTLTAVVIEGGRARLGHVGDSRAYLLRAGELRQLTEDHTLVRAMVASGEITEEEAETHPHRSILTRALGVDMTLDVDEGELELRPGDRLLLCTDGLTGMVAESRIAEILSSMADPGRAARDLVEAANLAGGADNITAVVLDVAEGEHLATEARASSYPTAVEPERSVHARRSFPLARVAVWVGVAAAVLVVLLVGTRVYLDSQWYVGVADGHVAVYRGIPAQVAGFDLHHVVVETTILAETAESLALYSDLADGITAENREAADAIVDRIRQDVAAMRETPAPP